MNKGILPPKLQFRDMADNTVTIEFGNETKTTYNYNNEDKKEMKSVITGNVSVLILGYYHSFTIDVLETADNPTLYDKITKIKTGSNFVLYPHQDDQTSYQVNLTKFKPYYANDLVYNDAFIIEFSTIGYV